MADDSGNEDQWLYGDSNQDAPEKDDKSDPKNSSGAVHNTDSQMDTLEDLGDQSLPAPEPPTIAPPQIRDGEHSELNIAEGEGTQISREQGEVVDAEGVAEDGKETENGIIGGVDDDDEEEDSDDDVQVVIGDIKTSPTYTSLNIKRGGLLTSTVGGEKLKQPGKFSIEEFEAIGTINGVPAHEFNLDSLEDKPWRKPGADITDYFNYGFNEETWRAYCERQKRIRIHESGVGLAQIGTAAGRGAIPVAITNDNSKYSGFMGPKKAGPPPGRKMGGTIDVIGAGGLASRRNLDKGTPPKENVIQVMTADRREYSRKPPFPDITVPPPTTIPPPFELPPPPHGVIPPVPPSFPPPPPPHIEAYANEFYTPETDPYYQSYEPTQDSQWNDPTWQPTRVPVASDVKVLTPSPIVSHLPPVISASSGGLPPETASQDSRSSLRDHGDDNASVAGGRAESISKDSSEKEPKERTRDKDRDKSERHRDRYRSHRHRSRSRSTEKRSRRHKSRSRSPGHRSHRKKKSRRSDREKSKEESE